MARVLIVDDDEAFARVLSHTVERLGHDTDTVGTCAKALSAASAHAYDVLYLDVNLPDGNGLEILPLLQQAHSHPETIIITGAGNADGASLAIRSGAWDYIEKSATRQEMTLPLVRALQYRGERQTKKTRLFNRSAIVGDSPSLRLCLEAAAQAAESDASVLIVGETGTGKELIASAIHENGARKQKSFVVVDCAALPETLVESILFGHVKGAFTGANTDREGLVLQADGGTLFLDEIGELPLQLQKSFLRVLEEHCFRPVGGHEVFSSDFRLIAATNRDLEAMARAGEFRQDLLFRLRVLTVEVPPLRERKEDIRAIAMHHVNMLCEKHGVATKGFSPDFFSMLTAYDWPGNVRELVHALDRVFAYAREDNVLFPKHLPTELRVKMSRYGVHGQVPQVAISPDVRPKPASLPAMKEMRDAAIATAERRYLEDLMALTEGNINAACKISGLSVPRLYALLKQYEISRKGG
ncbi:MAG: sigma-54 dependent transcriptional regulator [Candidatus Hydrogenedentes bacterium]|nr:sigma-54 dependent transcriptional regulator [Candidatus Hydrogenedentota bacterium]